MPDTFLDLFKRRGITSLVLILVASLPLHLNADDATEKAGSKPDPGEPATAPSEEPPAEYLLEVDGQAIDIRVGETVTIKIAGQAVTARLKPKPEKLFKAGGVSFRYPSQHSFEIECTPDGRIIWSLDGNDNVLTLIEISAAMDALVLRTLMRDGLVDQYGHDNCQISKVSAVLGGKPHGGVRVTAKLAGAMIHQDVYSWTGAETAYVLIIQDSPAEDETPSAETVQVLKLLEKTFQFFEPAAQENEAARPVSK